MIDYYTAYYGLTAELILYHKLDVEALIDYNECIDSLFKHINIKINNGYCDNNKLFDINSNYSIAITELTKAIVSEENAVMMQQLCKLLKNIRKTVEAIYNIH